MYFTINILFIIFFIIFSKIFFRSRDTFSYIKLIKVYLFFFILLIIFSINYDFLNLNQQFNYLCLIANFFLFINYILVVGIKFISGPSSELIAFLEKNCPCNKDKILSYLKSLNIVEERLQILQNENLLSFSNNSLSLTNNGKLFCKIFLIIKKFLGLEAEG